MRAVVQRVSRASVAIEGEVHASMEAGLLILLGVGQDDEADDARWLASKIAKMRIFSDGEKGMNASVLDLGGEVIVVSQFTLFASTKKGNRPSFMQAAQPETAEALYEEFCELVANEIGKPVGRGVFGADMKVSIENDGPVTIHIDTRNRM